MNNPESRKILVVDDDPDMVSVLNQILVGEGFEVVSLSDGEEALKFLQKSQADALVTDVMLPRMDGWTLCKKIKQNPATRNLPVLVLTAKGEDTSELMSYESGADEHIAKPFNNDHFISVIRQLTLKKVHG